MGSPTVRLKPTHEKQYDEDDQDDADDTDAPVTKAVAIAAEAATKATKQEDDEDDDEYESDRHDLSPVAAPIKHWASSHAACKALHRHFSPTLSRCDQRGSRVRSDPQSHILGAARSLVHYAKRGCAREKMDTAVAHVATDASRAAFRPGQLGPVKAKFLADAAYNARVEGLARSAERNFRLPPFVMD